MKKIDQKKELLLSLLKGAHRGRENLISGAELARAIHIGDKELRRKINQLRWEGNPIGSTHEGYFYAVNAGELYATIRMLKLMVKGLERAIQGLERALEHFQFSTQNPAQAVLRGRGNQAAHPHP